MTHHYDEATEEGIGQVGYIDIKRVKSGHDEDCVLRSGLIAPSAPVFSFPRTSSKEALSSAVQISAASN
jgi:hypothetical protein